MGEEGGTFIWMYAIIVTGLFLAIYSIFSMLRIQDIGRSTEESATLHVQAENFALDALDMYLELKHKHDNIAIVLEEDVPKVIEYVRDKVALYESMKGDVQNLQLTGEYVYPGDYGVIGQGPSGDKILIQTIDQVPYYSATLTGEIKRIVKSVNDEPTIPFKQEIFIRASHITRLPSTE